MKLANKNVRLTKKLDSLKTKRVGKDGEEGQTEFHAQTQDYAFDPSSIPPTLEFKLQALPTDYNSTTYHSLQTLFSTCWSMAPRCSLTRSWRWTIRSRNAM
jgi:hypothetical protein